VERKCFTAEARRRGEEFRIAKMKEDDGTGTGRKLIHQELTEQIIGAAIEVHKAIGPGLLESVYQECMCRELNPRRLRFQREFKVPVIYKGVALDCGYRLDFIVEDTVILELKSADRIVPVHEAHAYVPETA
jgi:GxxExxY protein